MHGVMKKNNKEFNSLPVLPVLASGQGRRSGLFQDLIFNTAPIFPFKPNSLCLRCEADPPDKMVKSQIFIDN